MIRHIRVPLERNTVRARGIERHVQLGPHERDVALTRMEVTGRKNNKKLRSVYQVIDRRDLETGYTGTSRTVGYAASIGAHMMGSSHITKRGLASAVSDVPHRLQGQELAKRATRVTSQLMACEQLC